MIKTDKIYVAGHRGMVGSALVRKLEAEGFSNIITRTHSELDLTRQADVEEFFENEKPDNVFLAAAKVGGIHANNTYRAEFIYQNMMIAANVINSAYKCGVKKLFNLGSSCIYPKMAKQPMPESELLAGYLEPTNEPYAIAKISAIKLCESYNNQYGTEYISGMPTNLYGINDNYHPENSHVLPALIRRFHEAKLAETAEVVVWGTGTPKREFLFADDLADACFFLMQNYAGEEHVNLGTGVEVTIRELAETVKEVVGYKGELTFDTTKPDGTPRKLLDCTKLHELGWKHTTTLKSGIEQAYADFCQKLESGDTRLSH